MPCIRIVSLKPSRSANTVLLCRMDENVNALLGRGPSGVTMRKNGRFLADSFHLRVHDSLPIGGRCFKRSSMDEIPLNAPSAIP